jgi:hypothetical protein
MSTTPAATPSINQCRSRRDSIVKLLIDRTTWMSVAQEFLPARGPTVTF